MRGPFYSDKTGVTGEPHVKPSDFARNKTENYRTYYGEDGKLHTEILAKHTVEEHGDQN